jgi:hypothetical protein
MIPRLLLLLLLAGGTTSAPTPTPTREWSFSTGRVLFTNTTDTTLERVSVFIMRNDRKVGNQRAQVRTMSGDIVTTIGPKGQVEIVSPEADLMIQQKRPFTIYVLHEPSGVQAATIVGRYPPLR